MKSTDALLFIARIFEGMEKQDHTGAIDIHADCTQGCIASIKIAITEKKVTVFEMQKENTY
jgi:hypothetical protein